MRKIIICLWSFVALLGSLQAQDSKEPIISTKLQFDTVSMAEPCRLTFTVENSRSVSIEKINFRDFDILQGPFQSSQFSMVNGVSSSSTTFTYMLKAREKGSFIIESQKLYINGNSYNTSEIAIVVVEEYERKNNALDNNPFDMPSMGFNEDIFGRMQQQQEEMMKRQRELFNNPDGFFNNPNDIFNFPRQFGPDMKDIFKNFDNLFKFELPPVQPKQKPSERIYRL
jgi:hypothetical protein